jgi:hypothetical protein
MKNITQKREAGLLDGTPEKRMYWSIISDYDIQTGISELIDNAIDQWMGSKAQQKLLIDLKLDWDRQLIQIKDNAGGVKEEDLRLLIAPGASRNDPDAESIGIFGVGSKRAVVALAEIVIIKTRYSGGNSCQIDISRDWLESPDWQIPHYEIPEMEEGVTSVELSSLRKSFGEGDVDDLKKHIGETYAWYLNHGNCEIKVNGVSVKPSNFDNWAYPREFGPQQANFTVDLKEHGKVNIEIVSGLILDRDPSNENYGVYFYCNNRLIVKELKTREVGYFVSSEAGVPHPDASLCRAIVKITGSAKLMPWNSSKSGINFSHQIFQGIRPTLVPLVSYFSSLSRRLKNDWDRKVFKFNEGDIQPIEAVETRKGKRLVLPPLPKVNQQHIEILKAKNKTQIKDQPWTLGLVEAVAAIDIIGRQKLETRNRINLILLDSNFEIALKEFIVHREDLFPQNQFNIQQMKRHEVVKAVAQKVLIPKVQLDKANHYYLLRNKLIHERATVNITDTDIENYRDIIEQILTELFNLKF